MQYIKYNNNGTDDENETLKSLYRKACQKEKIGIIKEKFFRTIATFLFFVTWIGLFVGAYFLIEIIISKDNSPLLEILNAIIRIVLIIVAAIISFLFATLVSAPFFNISDKKAKSLKRNLLSEVCIKIRRFYKLSDPYLITKCYECSDERFNRHDVCIFIVDEQLRISTNLSYGFINPNKDLGCYCFDKKEIKIRQVQNGKLFMTELRADSLRFLLGKNSKKFIQRNFLGNR